MGNLPHILERRWPGVILSPIQVNNSAITVTSTSGLHSKQKIVLLKTGIEPQEFEIKRILDETHLLIGPINTPIYYYENPVQFDGGTLSAEEQNRNPMDYSVCLRAVYQEEPSVALRTLLVDEYGRLIDSIVGADNRRRLCVDAAVTVVNPLFGVYITAKDNDPNLGDIHDSIRIGDGIDELQVNTDGSINTHNLDIPNSPFIFNIPVTAAHTEYSFMLPINTKRFGIKVRDYSAKLYLSFTANGTFSNFITVERGCSFCEDIVNAGLVYLYFRTDRPNQILEIWTWS